LSSEEAATLLRLRRLQLGIVLLRLVIGLALIEVIINQFATTKALPLFVLIAAPVLMLVFRKAIEKFYVRVESRFLRNLNAKELAEVESLTMLPQLAPWNANLTRLVLSPDSKLAGKTLEESKFRTRTGATIVMIDRGQKRIFAPNRDDRLWPHDELFVIGIEEQLIGARELIKPEAEDEVQNTGESYDLESLLLAENSPYAGKSIREIGLGEEFGGLIVGIERGGERILNPESSVILRRGDLIWIFGRRLLIRELKNAP
jgi:CPA2 family monovalent cation:H+ antiporter-2